MPREVLEIHVQSSQQSEPALLCIVCIGGGVG